MPRRCREGIGLILAGLLLTPAMEAARLTATAAGLGGGTPADTRTVLQREVGAWDAETFFTHDTPEQVRTVAIDSGTAEAYGDATAARVSAQASAQVPITGPSSLCFLGGWPLSSARFEVLDELIDFEADGPFTVTIHEEVEQRHVIDSPGASGFDQAGVSAGSDWRVLDAAGDTVPDTYFGPAYQALYNGANDVQTQGTPKWSRTYAMQPGQRLRRSSLLRVDARAQASGCNTFHSAGMHAYMRTWLEVAGGRLKASGSLADYRKAPPFAAFEPGVRFDPALRRLRIGLPGSLPRGVRLRIERSSDLRTWFQVPAPLFLHPEGIEVSLGADADPGGFYRFVEEE